MGVKYESRYCYYCDSYDLISEEGGEDHCPVCAGKLSDEASELSDANMNNSIHLPEIMGCKLIDALERIEVLESQLSKVDSVP